jgi:hypothetical protein
MRSDVRGAIRYGEHAVSVAITGESAGTVRAIDSLLAHVTVVDRKGQAPIDGCDYSRPTLVTSATKLGTIAVGRHRPPRIEPRSTVLVDHRSFRLLTFSAHENEVGAARHSFDHVARNVVEKLMCHDKTADTCGHV